MRLLVLLCLFMTTVLLLSPLSFVYAAATAQIAVTPLGQANVTLTYTYQDFDTEYAAYTSSGEAVFKVAIVIALASLGWTTDSNSINIQVYTATKTMGITVPINEFAKKTGDFDWQILLGPTKTIYTQWTRTEGTFVFTAASTPHLPLPEIVNLQLSPNAVDIQFDSTNYVITYKASGCLIATALYGSPLEPEVQFLRHFRDDTLTGLAGKSFVSDLNAWYYSFSPQVAQYIQQNQWTRLPMILLISPVVSLLHTADAIIELLTD
jgi:hypothetical protein